MEHPPIPPNCEFFKEQKTGTIFAMPGEVLWMDRPLIGARRIIIASVARCFWLDEYQRLCDINGGSDDECSMRVWQRLAADDYAKAWQEWGNLK